MVCYCSFLNFRVEVGEYDTTPRQAVDNFKKCHHAEQFRWGLGFIIPGACQFKRPLGLSFPVSQRSHWREIRIIQAIIITA